MEKYECICGADLSAVKPRSVHGVQLRQCTRCGAEKQVCDKLSTYDEWRAYYEREYKPGKIHTYYHDRRVAYTRWLTYGLEELARIHGLRTRRLLDVGAGNGAWIDECRSRGWDAIGCDPCERTRDLGLIYNLPLEQAHIPTASYDVVTCHDVLEHAWDPREVLAHAWRVLKPNGLFILDWPNAHSRHGRHHYRPVEHIWYLSPERLERLIREAGYELLSMRQPIPAKILMMCRKIERRQRTGVVLLPPGIGDIYWAAVKLKAILRAEGLELPQARIYCPETYSLPQRDADTRRRRGFGLIRDMPFVEPCDEIVSTASDAMREAWQISYIGKALNGESYQRAITKSVNADLFVCYNGYLRAGYSLAEADPQYGCDWLPMRHVSLARIAARRRYAYAYGRYALLYLSGDGMFRSWLKRLPAQRLADEITCAIDALVRDGTIDRCVLVCKGYDVDETLHPRLMASRNIVALIDQTDYDSLCGLIDAARVVIGWPSGLTVLAAAYRVPTTIVWNETYFRSEAFHRNACPPESVGAWYWPITIGSLATAGAISAHVTAACKELAEWSG